MQYFFSHIVWKKKISLKYSLDSSRTDPDPKWKFYLKRPEEIHPKKFLLLLVLFHNKQQRVNWSASFFFFVPTFHFGMCSSIQNEQDLYYSLG